MKKCLECEHSDPIPYSIFLHCQLTDRNILPDKIVTTCPVNQTSYNEALINQMEIEKGIDEDTIYQCLAKLGEEYGELCQAILERDGVKVYAGKPRHDPADEIADCVIVLHRLSRRLRVNINTAVKEKLEKDKLKVYQMVVD